MEVLEKAQGTLLFSSSSPKGLLLKDDLQFCKDKFLSAV